MNISKISVIVPVYNVEKYLPRCIDSILAQTFTNFELLLIDDGSKDRSGEICEEYAKKDPRIRVFHKENGGVSSARNLGLDNAKGEWICFADSDDKVSDDYLKHMTNAINDEVMLIISNYRKEKDSICAVKLFDAILHDKDIVRYFITNKVFALSAPYSKLYNYEVIKKHSLKFPIGIQMGEDAIFIMKYLNKVSCVTVIDECDYFVSETEGSLSSKYYSFEKEWECYKIWKSEMMIFLTRFGHIYDNPTKVAWENRIGETFNRCLQCLYRQSNKVSFQKQLNYLCSIPYTEIQEFSKYYIAKTRLKKCLKFLISHRYFSLYLVCGIFDRCKKGGILFNE